MKEAEITYQPITETLEKNYMPYVMSVIISRALPEIDGFKPSHRKLLYTMYSMGLLTGARTKSANVVGQTMRLNPHGDAAIYETMVRLTRANESLLHPFIDSKGSFGKQYSRDMAYAASRYTEVKLDAFCAELFSGIEKDAVDFVPNYDNTMQEPTLLPTTFPNILVSPNLGIAVGMACSICSFNLSEICDGTIALLKNPKVTVDRMLEIVKAPDFSGGGTLLYDREQMKKIYTTGVGSLRLRGRYTFDAQRNCIDVFQIPYSSCTESILKKVGDLVKAGKMKDIVDYRDATDLGGLRLTFDLRRGADPDAVMDKLFYLTELENTFDCNFNILVNGSPRQMGIVEILTEWISFRLGCMRREMTFDLGKKKDKLHLLLGLATILLDIDKAIAIIRSTAKESEVVVNLMKGFDLSKVQAEYIAEIKLRHLNREYITHRIEEVESLQKEIAELEEILADELKMKGVLIEQLKEIKRKHGKPRKTQIMDAGEIHVLDKAAFIENYNVRLVVTAQGYFKKITSQSLRGNDLQKLKEGDFILSEEDTDNLGEIIVFTNKAQMYRAKVADFEPVKASAMGDFLPAKLKMDAGEIPLLCKVVSDLNPDHQVLVVFENGKGVRIPMSLYETKSNRRKITGVYSTKSPAVAVIYLDKPRDVVIRSSQERAILISSELVPQVATRTAGGNTLFTVKPPKIRVIGAELPTEALYENAEGYRKRKVPATGNPMTKRDVETFKERVLDTE
ncbi:MAG: topoisomerase IV [Ruminococcaceae bacterium]|nr:topoisomerase IV [Oscillospiraceae bacterium]